MLKKIIPHHEHWPSLILLFFVWPYYLWKGMWIRDFGYFTAANPAIEDGGFFGEKKKEILNLFPEKYVAKNILITAQNKMELKELAAAIGYPLVCKPNVGERGYQVAVVYTEEELIAYSLQNSKDFLIQEFVSFPFEFGVLFYKIPGEINGHISSVVLKDFMKVTGDGVHTVQQLMGANDFYKPHIERLSNVINMDEILPIGDKKLLEPIGNHCRGTKFIDARHLVTKELTDVFNRIFDETKGVFYGRCDLKCTSIDDFKLGKNILILEFNGVTSDPAHIFDSTSKFTNAIKDLWKDARIIFLISEANKKLGVKTTPFFCLIRKFLKHRKEIKSF